MLLVATGHSFERKEIEEWMAKNNTCPKTRKELEDKTIVVNWNLKTNIEEWLVRVFLTGLWDSICSKPVPVSC